MNIESTSPKSELKSPGNQANKGSADVHKPAQSAVKETGPLQAGELLTRSMETLLRNINPGDRSLDLLRALVQLVSRLPVSSDRLPENTGDARLLLRVFKEFREKHSHRISPGVLREMKHMEKLLEESHSRDGSLLLSLAEDSENGSPAVTVRRRPDGDSREKEGQELRLRLDLDHLGPVSVILSRRGERQSCRLMAADKDSRVLLKRGQSLLRQQIKKRGLRLDDLTVQLREDTALCEKETIRRDLDLWG